MRDFVIGMAVGGFVIFLIGAGLLAWWLREMFRSFL